MQRKVELEALKKLQADEIKTLEKNLFFIDERTHLTAEHRANI